MDNINGYNIERLKRNFDIIIGLEWLGVRFEDTKEEKDSFGLTTKAIYYCSVPESSTIEVDGVELNSRVKTSDELKKFTKECLTDMIVGSFESAFPNDKDLIEDVKNNISDYFKLYAKVRKGEIWNEEMGNNRVKELCDEIQKVSGYEEI